MINTLTNALTTCAITTILIDVPVRSGITYYLELPVLYPIVSAVATYSTCIIKQMLPVCEEHSIICSGVSGATKYSARAATLLQNIPARIVLGTANGAAYKFAAEYGGNTTVVKYGAPIVIETIEAAAIALIRGEGDVLLGTAIGVSLSICINLFAAPALEYMTEPVSSTSSADVCLPTNFDQHDMCLTGDMLDG